MELEISEILTPFEARQALMGCNVRPNTGGLSFDQRLREQVKKAEHDGGETAVTRFVRAYLARYKPGVFVRDAFVPTFWGAFLRQYADRKIPAPVFEGHCERKFVAAFTVAFPDDDVSEAYMGLLRKWLPNNFFRSPEEREAQRLAYEARQTAQAA